MLAILCALASAIGYGASDYAAGLATRAASVIRVTILAEAASVLALLLVAPWVSTQTPSAASVAWAAVAGLGGIIGAMTLYLGFRHAAFSVAGPLSAVASAGFSVLAGLLFGEHPSGLALAGIALALPAIVAVSASRGGEREGGDSGSRAAGTAYGLVAGACFAVLFIGLNRSGSRHDWWPLVIAQVTGLIGGPDPSVSRVPPPPPGPRLAILAGVTVPSGSSRLPRDTRGAAGAVGVNVVGRPGPGGPASTGRRVGSAIAVGGSGEWSACRLPGAPPRG